MARRRRQTTAGPILSRDCVFRPLARKGQLYWLIEREAELPSPSLEADSLRPLSASYRSVPYQRPLTSSGSLYCGATPHLARPSRVGAPVSRPLSGHSLFHQTKRSMQRPSHSRPRMRACAGVRRPRASGAPSWGSVPSSLGSLCWSLAEVLPCRPPWVGVAQCRRAQHGAELSARGSMRLTSPAWRITSSTGGGGTGVADPQDLGAVHGGRHASPKKIAGHGRAFDVRAAAGAVAGAPSPHFCLLFPGTY